MDIHNKCNENLESKYAYIDNIPIHVKDYIEKYHNKTKLKILCNKGHELVCVNGSVRQPHFRHKNPCDVTDVVMTKWHCEWQSNFPNTECLFPKLHDGQVKDRRADVLLENHKVVIEFQHSNIEPKEVQERKNDYALHNHKTIWVIHGNNSVTTKKLDYSNRVYLEFVTEKWKYKSFSCYEYIFIDIDGYLYKVYPNDVKSDMIDVEKPIEKQRFIELITANDDCIHNIDIPMQCNLYVKQQGAGNGKTFGLIQMLESCEFEHYTYFIVVTKQHSAKYVIYKEFKDQIEKGYLKYLRIESEEDLNKKFKIKYVNNKTNTSCQLIIGTIDSLMYTLGNKHHGELNKFEGVVNSIIDGYINQPDKNHFSYCGINIKFNKEVCLICDETQDLPIDYAKAIIQIMRNKYIDSYIVGDKLQSLVNIENAFTYITNNEFPYIKNISFESTNVCRRFYNQDLVNFVNNIVPFEKYHLPVITPYILDQDNNKALQVFVGKDIYANEMDEIKINEEVVQIMKYYEKEVIDNNYKPNDFLFITPFTTKNPLVNIIETAINMFWAEKFKDKNYKRYAIFHKSEEGTSIDLSESEDATRLVSIHTSKGDGRNVVFIVGLDEKSLLRFSNEKDNLIYDSLIHVAFTRMKKKLYIRLIDNNDDIHQNIYNYAPDITTLIQPCISISKKVKYNDIISKMLNNVDYNEIKEYIIDNVHLPLLDDNTEKYVIDMGHHTIRYASMISFLFIKILQNENINSNNNVRKQIKAVLCDIKDAYIHKFDNWKQYNDVIKIKEIAILNMSKSGTEYVNYYNILINIIKNVKSKLKCILNANVKLLCPLESVALYYLIELRRNGVCADITIQQLYNIINIYSKSFNSSMAGHDDCLCKTIFKDQLEPINIDNRMHKYLMSHYELISRVGILYDDFLELNNNVNWLINHKLKYNGNNVDFEIDRKFKLIGYNEKTVYNVYLKPQLNELNYNETIMNSILDTFLLHSIKPPQEVNENNEQNYNKEEQDYEKFANKKIITIVFSLDQKRYITLDWGNLVMTNRNVLVNKCKDILLNKYIVGSSNIYNFYKYWKSNIDTPNLAPEKLLHKIFEKLRTNKLYDNIPYFVSRFFQETELKIKFCRTVMQKQIILDNLDDHDEFINSIRITISETIDDFFD